VLLSCGGITAIPFCFLPILVNLALQIGAGGLGAD